MEHSCSKLQNNLFEVNVMIIMITIELQICVIQTINHTRQNNIGMHCHTNKFRHIRMYCYFVKQKSLYK